MIIDLIAAVEFLKENNNYLILTHAHPDGDTLGCGLALKEALTALGKNAVVCCADAVPEKYSYMGSIGSDDFKPEKIIAVDVADTKLLGNDFEEKYAEKIDLCIDHHESNRLYAARTLLDASAAAACEIVLDVIRGLGVEITKRIADCIYTGLTTDTGSFRYSNVTPRTMYMAADMIAAGAENAKINTAMFETKTATSIALEGLAIKNMKMYFDNKCAFITITREMFRESGSDETETEAITALPRQIEGVKIGITMREEKSGKFKVSMRGNDDVNVAEICAIMGGGGHSKAAGCTVDGPLENATKNILENVGEYLNK